MTEAGLNNGSRDRTPPPLDTVMLWVTSTVERDWVARGVFPSLRTHTAQELRAAAALHFVTADQAEVVIADARCRVGQVGKSLRQAFGALLKSAQAAIKEADERPAIFGAAAAVCLHKSESGESWRGTKEQLQAQGISLESPWPTESGGRTRFANAKDSRGYRTIIKPYCRRWPGLFEASISVPYHVWAPKPQNPVKQSAVEDAQQSLKRMLDTPAKYRAHLIYGLRSYFGIILENAAKQSTWHAFTVGADSIGDIHASFDTIVEAIEGATLEFDEAHHRAIVEGYRATIAAADTSFQAKVSELLKPKLEILDGGLL